MENSFFEYQNRTVADSDSDAEIIDNSFCQLAALKTPAKKNKTVFVPESDDSSEDNLKQENDSMNNSGTVARRSIFNKHHVVLSSDDDKNSRGSVRRQPASNKVVITSSEDEANQASPEMIPKCQSKMKPSQRWSGSFIGRKKKKAMIIMDSESDNSFIKEHTSKRKCLKDTPVKIDNVPRNVIADVKNMSIQSDVESDQSGDGDSEDGEGSDVDANESRDSDSGEASSGSDAEGKEPPSLNANEAPNESNKCVEQNETNEENSVNTSDEGLREEQMVMSRATRMSIMGVIPKENDSDDSDYIQSDNTTGTSRASSIDNLCNGPDSESQLNTTPKTKNVDDNDSSSLTCSPIATTPLHDITKEVNNPKDKSGSVGSNDNSYSPEVCGLKERVLNKLNKDSNVYKERIIDDDLTIIDKEPEIIALSSEDEDEVKEIKTSPNIKKSPKPKGETAGQIKSNNIKQFLAPPSYPNQIVYVKKHVRENELSKLNGLREDLQNVRYLLDNMEVSTLPDGGAKLIERLTALERDVQRQGDKVANMVVEMETPIQEISKDASLPDEKGWTWDDIQKGSNAVQPRMFGKQAMSTHMAERNLMLNRLRDLYESLASRPSEDNLSKQPSTVKTELMEHQLHALAWLRWRETQKPSGGILADDMGLGKTITMISLIVSDKEGSIDNDDDDDTERGGKLAQGGTLVVCPATLVSQWAGEVNKHCSAHALSVCLHHGSARATQPHRLAVNDLVITTYNILQRESEKNGVLSRVRWRRVILDEAHVVRNHKSATSQGVCGLRGQRRWALTGTPLHNKDLDLFALLKFLKCTPFDELTMWKKWIDNKSLGGSQRLNTIMSCVMLRRTKLQLQEKGQLTCLPKRSMHDCHVTLSQEEMNVYQKVLVFSKTLFAQFLHQRAETRADLQGISGPKKDSEYAKMHKRMIALQGAKPVKSHEILVLLLRLRQVCCHCGLIAAMLDGDSSETELAEDTGSQDLMAELNKLSLEDSSPKKKDEEEEANEGTTAAEAIKSVLSINNPVFQLQRQSSKIKEVMQCLTNNVFKNKGDKAVVVSQWTSVLNLVEKELRTSNIPFATLRGDVPVPARAPIIATINNPRSDVKVLLLSLCAGGVGLNLCGANHLLLLDPHWNPQLEEQAQDRVYRVGQQKHVHIYRFMCVDTVEQSIRKLQKTKLELAENVLTGARNTNGSKLSIEDLKELFNMTPHGAS